MREGAKTNAARALRRNMTDAEHHLWRYLRRRQLLGHRFRRQHPLGPYVADFICIEKRLVIEVDGSQHLESPDDARRDGWMRRQGFITLRCWNHDVLERTEVVLEMILRALE